MDASSIWKQRRRQESSFTMVSPDTPGLQTLSSIARTGDLLVWFGARRSPSTQKNCRKTLSAQIRASRTKCAPGRGALYRDNLQPAGGAMFTVRFRVDGEVPPNHAPINMRLRQACSDRARLLSPIGWFGVSLWRAGLYANFVRPGGQRRNSIESARTGQEIGPTGAVTGDCCRLGARSIAPWNELIRKLQYRRRLFPPACNFRLRSERDRIRWAGL